MNRTLVRRRKITGAEMSKNIDRSNWHYNDYMDEACIIVGNFLKKVFLEVRIDGPAITPDEINAHPTMLVSSHRSHLDYILLGIIFNAKGLRNLRFAAGDNLTSMPWVGRRFVSYGAFSVYRSKANSRSYFFDLAEQVTGMMTSGENVIVFPEGGRSYSGAMLEMKSGILAATIMAAGRMPDKTFRYIPMTVVYDELPELAYFGMLDKGKRLRAESKDGIKKILGNLYYFGADLFAFGSLMLLSRFGRRYGKVYVDYGSPIDVRSIVDVEGNFAKGSRNEFLGHRASIGAAGDSLLKKITALYRVLPSHVLSAALDGCYSAGMSDLVIRVKTIVEKAEAAGRNLINVKGKSAEEIIEEGLVLLRRYKAVKRTDSGVRVKKMQIISYHARTLSGIGADGVQFTESENAEDKS